MDNFEVGDIVTPKEDQPSMYHGKIGVVKQIFSEYIVLVDFGIIVDGKKTTVAVMTYALEKAILN